MLRETAPQGTSTERFEVISKFLTTTEEYLNKLSSKVASVKMTQEASEAAALAVSKARAQVDLHSLLMHAGPINLQIYPFAFRYLRLKWRAVCKSIHLKSPLCLYLWRLYLRHVAISTLHQWSHQLHPCCVFLF